MKKLLVAACFAVSALVAAVSPAAGGDSSAEFKPELFAKLAPCLYTPDGLTVCEKTGQIFLNVPNFSQKGPDGKKMNSAQGGYLVELYPDGNYKIVLVYPILEATGQCGPMGLDFGPDGNLYVCDNQYFYDKNFKSRILRVLMKDGEPTGQVEVAVDGLKLANAVLWFNNKMFVTDTALDIEDPNSTEFIGCGGVWMFDGQEVLAAGKEGKAPIRVQSADKDPRMLVTRLVHKVGRGDDGGADGLTVDTKRGVLYFGHFGDGQLHAIYPDANGNYSAANVGDLYDPTDKDGFGGNPPLQCCDGIYYDKVTDRIFINDSKDNAVRWIAPVAKGEKAKVETLWRNGDTTGDDGSLDQPCESVVVDGKLIVVNFDWPFPGLTNTKVEIPGTISVIDISSLSK